MIDLHDAKNHQRSRRKSGYIKDKMGFNSKIYLVVNEYGIPTNFIVTDGPCADCKEAIDLIKNIKAKLVFVGHAYDTNEILSCSCVGTF